MSRKIPGGAAGPAPGWSWKQAVAAIGGGREEGVERMLERCARACGLTYGTVRALYYQQIVNPDWTAGLAIQARLAAGGTIARGLTHDARQMEAELASVEKRLAALEAIALAHMAGAGAPAHPSAAGALAQAKV